MDAIITVVALCLLLGAVVGILAGLLGIGGGLIIVPILAFLFQKFLDVSIEYGMQMAIASSLSTVIFTGLSSARSHYKLGNIDKKIVMVCGAGIAFGAILGALFATQISGLILKRIFAGLVLIIALQMIFGRNRVSKVSIGNPTYATIGLGSGFVAALMGIGGGAILVPVLVWFQTHIKTAIGCAALCGVVIATFGTATFVFSGWNADFLPKYALGYVYLPATIGIALTSMITAPIGAKLTVRLDTQKLKKIFAVFLVLVSIRLIIGLE